MMTHNRSPRSLGMRAIPLISSLAALYAAVSLLPSFPIIGVAGSRISIARSLEMSYGIILGPIIGPLTAFLGAFIGKILSMDFFGIYFTPLAFISSLTAAAMSRYRVFNIRGWIVASFISMIFIISWYATPIGRKAPLYPMPHLIGLIIIITWRDKIAGYIHSGDKTEMVMGVALCGFSSTMTGHMLGNLIFMALLSNIASPSFFMALLPLSVMERLMITLIGTVIGVPFILIVKRNFPNLIRNMGT